MKRRYPSDAEVAQKMRDEKMYNEREIKAKPPLEQAKNLLRDSASQLEYMERELQVVRAKLGVFEMCYNMTMAQQSYGGQAVNEVSQISTAWRIREFIGENK